MVWLARVSVFHGAPTLPAAGVGLIRRQWDCNSSCQLCAYKTGQGILLFRQITASDNRTETHDFISARLTFQSFLTPRKDTAEEMEGNKRPRGLGCRDARMVTHLWINTFPGLGWGCLLAFPKDHWLWKDFKSSPHQEATTKPYDLTDTKLPLICIKGKKKRGRYVCAMWWELISIPPQGWACQQVKTSRVI